MALTKSILGLYNALFSSMPNALNMGGYKITNLAAPSNSGDVARIDDIASMIRPQDVGLLAMNGPIEAFPTTSATAGNDRIYSMKITVTEAIVTSSTFCAVFAIVAAGTSIVNGYVGLWGTSTATGGDGTLLAQVDVSTAWNSATATALAKVTFGNIGTLQPGEYVLTYGQHSGTSPTFLRGNNQSANIVNYGSSNPASNSFNTNCRYMKATYTMSTRPGYPPTLATDSVSFFADAQLPIWVGLSAS